MSWFLIVEITENTSGLATNEFSFKFTNVIPPENVDPYGEAEIAYIYFDMGDITGLIKDVKILESSAGVSMTIPSRRSQMKIMNRFDRNFSADFSIGRASRRRGKDGINPGEWVIVAVTLCDGKSYDDLMTALTIGQSKDEAIAKSGFRISTIVHRIWGRQEEADHAAFVVSDQVTFQITDISASPAFLTDTQRSKLHVELSGTMVKPDSLRYKWTISKGHGTLENANSATPVYIPKVGIGNESVMLTVVITDGTGTVSRNLMLCIDPVKTDPTKFDPNKKKK